jgi:'Cold-shock' DNA-binding domain
VERGPFLISDLSSCDQALSERAPTGLGWAHEIKADGYRAQVRKVERRGWDLVSWYNAERGFGFVSLGGGVKDVFVRASVVVNSSVASQSEYGVDDAMS